MTATYDLIASNVLTSSASSVTFSSIPATYRDLVLVVNAISATGTVLYANFNSSTAAEYTFVRMSGNGSSATSAAPAADILLRLTFNAQIGTTASHSTILQILDYSATNKHKTTLTRSNNAGIGVDAFAGRWANTSAITSVRLEPNTGSFSSDSSFYLYGIVS